MTGRDVARSQRARERVARVKLDVPPLPPGHVSRLRLLERLDGARDGQVVVVSAPAGFGKTTLLADWVGGRRSHTAWLSLSGEDNDDRTFWSGVLAALAACPAVPPGSPLTTVVVPVDPSADADFQAGIADGLDALPEPITLVLDDIHELVAPQPVRGLTSLVRDRPRGVRIVLSGRSDPLLPLGRLRVADRLCEVRSAHLQFTTDEAARMLAGIGPAGAGLAPALVVMLTEQTGGWAAGLRLAAPSLLRTEDRDRFLRELIGSGRVLSDYLIGEVLDGMSAPVRALLDALSICAEVTAPLAAAVSGMPDAGDVLDRLERETGLVVSSGLGRVRYAVQPLLRTYLQIDLRRRRPDTVAVLHARVTVWYAGQRRPAQALEHAIAAGRPQLLADLLHSDGVLLVAQGEHAGVLRAVRGLGEDVLTTDPWLSLLAALAHLEIGELTAADRYLGHADAVWPAEPTADLAALRSVGRSRRGALAFLPELGEDVAPAVVDLAEHRLGLAPLALIESGYAALVTRRPEAAQDMAEAALARAQGHPYLTAQSHVLLAGVAAEQGDFPRMGAFAEQAATEIAAAGGGDTRATAVAAVFRSYRALLLGRPHECLQLAQPAVAFIDALAGDAPAELTTVVGAIRGAAEVDAGDHAAGLATLADARLGAGSTSARATVMLALLEQGAATALGFVERARATLTWAAETLGDAGPDAGGELVLLRAHHQFQLGRGAAATGLLDTLLDGSAVPLLPWTIAEAWVLRSRLALQMGEHVVARDALDRAVQACAALDVLRPLVFAPAEIVERFRDYDGVPGPAAVVDRVRQARQALGGGLPVALTDRERTVLRLLMTQRSMGEIAADLTLSTNTVKTHVRAIYRKLGVRTRREAIVAARERRLTVALTSEALPIRHG